MGYRRRAGGGRRDAAEGAIIRALTAVGAQTWQVGGTSNPDLLVRFRDRLYGFEVKTGKGTLTKNQNAYDWPVIRTPEDALQHIGAAVR